MTAQDYSAVVDAAKAERAAFVRSIFAALFVRKASKFAHA